MSQKRLNISTHRIWKDKNIKPETKEIFAYLFAEGFEKTISNISIGRIQRELKSITNIGFRNNLKILEKYKYLVYKEYDKGLYEYHIY